MDLVVEAGLQSYDIVPLIPIVEAAGGVVTGPDGESPRQWRLRGGGGYPRAARRSPDARGGRSEGRAVGEKAGQARARILSRS